PLFFTSLLPRPPRPTLFPYTTLFRSEIYGAIRVVVGENACEQGDRKCCRAGERRIGFDVMRARTIVIEIEEAGAQVGEVVIGDRSEEHTSELQSRENLVCRLLLEKKK